MTRMATYDKRRRTARHIKRTRASRPKTFKSEEAAKTYAEANKYTKYTLVNISPSEIKTKIRIVQEE